MTTMNKIQAGITRRAAITVRRMFDDPKSGMGGITVNPATISAVPTKVNNQATGAGSGLLDTVTVTGTA
jgi:hypothetical protein